MAAHVPEPELGLAGDLGVSSGIPRLLGAGRSDAADAVELAGGYRELESLREQLIGTRIAAAQAHRCERGEEGDALLHAGGLRAAQQLARHARRSSPLAPVELAGRVIGADISAVREDAALFAVLDTFLKGLPGAREVVRESRIEEERPVGAGGMILEPLLERQRETALEGLVSRAIVGSEQRSADVAQRVRLGGAVAALAGEREGALPELERFAIPAAVHREQRPPAVGHRQR